MMSREKERESDGNTQRGDEDDLVLASCEGGSMVEFGVQNPNLTLTLSLKTYRKKILFISVFYLFFL